MNLTSQRSQLIDFSKSSSRMIVENFHPAYFKAEKSDTEKNFRKNLESQPADWWYRTNSVKYTINGQGYRCKPFDIIDWDKSILIFGCSNVYGDGLDNSDTLPARLQELTRCPVINLGSPGSSQLLSLYNMMILKNNNIKPKAVIHVWTESTRLLYLNNNFQHCHCGPNNNWGMEDSKGHALITESKAHIVSAMFNRMIANNVYHDIPVIHATYFDIMWQEQESMYPNFPMFLLLNKDQARDLCHPGRETNKDSAKILYNELLERQTN